MTINRYRLALNNARFPLVSTWGERAVIIPSMDIAVRANKGFQGGEEVDYDVPQIIYGENFIPVTNGIKSVSYTRIIQPTVNKDFDQIFPLRDDQENTVLYSPSHGKNYIYDKVAEAWSFTSTATLLSSLTPSYLVAEDSTNTPETAKITRAYVDGKTLVAYSRLGARAMTDPAGPPTKDASLYLWNPVAEALTPVGFAADLTVTNLSIPIGEIDGISSSSGYLVIWSGLSVYWAPFNGTSFDFSLYASGEVTGAGNQIPEDLQGPITSIVPVSGGFIMFTTKNAVAAFYNANNFASPWIFKGISNAGGIEGFEQAALEGNQGSLYAYTTGGLQRLSLNNAESPFPDVTDFLGGRYIELFNTGDLTFSQGAFTTEFFTKVTYCGQRFLVISYGTYPGVYSFALVFDSSLKRWGKLRIVHRDAFSYSYGVEDAQITYNMLSDVSYSDLEGFSYDEMIIQGGALTYPRQSLAFLLETGEVKLAVMDYRAAEDTSEAFVILGKNQLSRSRFSTVHEIEIEGLREGGQVAVWRSVNGSTLESADSGFLREQSGNYSEWGFDLVTGKNFTAYIKGDFALTSVIIHASNDGSY